MRTVVIAIASFLSGLGYGIWFSREWIAALRLKNRELACENDGLVDEVMQAKQDQWPASRRERLRDGRCA